MSYTKKILVGLLTLAVCGNLLQAQEEAPRHEVSATFQGLGLGSMPFKGQSWNDQPGLSLGFGVGYTYWFGNSFGFRTGLRMNRMSFNQEISNFDNDFSAPLPMSSLGLPGGSGLTTVNLNSKAASIQEEQQYSFVELPLMLAMRCRHWSFNVGLSLAKAVSATADYSYTDPSCSIVGLPDLGVTPATPVPMTLTGETGGSVRNRNMAKPLYCLLAAEAGYNIPVGDAADLSIGLFGRFAPVASKTRDAAEAYTISPDASYHLSQPSTSTLAERKGYYEVGLSLGLNFGIGKKKGQSDKSPVTSSGNNGNADAGATSAELAAAKAARQKAEDELAAAKAARVKAEGELAALENARKKAEDDLDSYRRSLKEQQAQQARQAQQNESRDSRPAAASNSGYQEEKPLYGMVFYFDFDEARNPKYDIETEANLRALCSSMQKDPSIKVNVIGHTDNVGTIRNNNKIGRKRANAVKKLMVGLGAPADNIGIITRGENEPKETNETEDGRALNRRATIELQ